MLVPNLIAIGNKLYAIRRKAGMTQAEVADAAGVSDRTYADIERGKVNMRLETVLRICEALCITPDEILTVNHSSMATQQEELIKRLDRCNSKDKETALTLLSVYLRSIE